VEAEVAAIGVSLRVRDRVLRAGVEMTANSEEEDIVEEEAEDVVAVDDEEDDDDNDEEEDDDDDNDDEEEEASCNSLLPLRVLDFRSVVVVVMSSTLMTDFLSSGCS
jgi:hypothetical protein